MREINIMDCAECFAVPNARGIIDMIHPATGKSWHFGQDLEQMRKRYPKAERMTYEAWKQAEVKRQRTPICWVETTHGQFDDMLNVLPPAAQGNGGFLVGEPMDHDAGNGQPRFEGFAQRGKKFYASNRPITRAEFAAAMLAPLNIVSAQAEKKAAEEFNHATP